VVLKNLTLPAHKLFGFLPSGIFRLIVMVRFDENEPSLNNVTGVFQFESLKDKLGA